MACGNIFKSKGCLLEENLQKEIYFRCLITKKAKKELTFSATQDLSSAVSAFSMYLPRFIQTITSLKTTGIPESIPVSMRLQAKVFWEFRVDIVKLQPNWLLIMRASKGYSLLFLLDVIKNRGYKLFPGFFSAKINYAFFLSRQCKFYFEIINNN